MSEANGVVKQKAKYASTMKNDLRYTSSDVFETFPFPQNHTSEMETELEKIGAALSRMEKGTYGVCSNCQKEIPLERLQAYPQADTCLDCKK